VSAANRICREKASNDAVAVGHRILRNFETGRLESLPHENTSRPELNEYNVSPFTLDRGARGQA
jgi:hypothetical protein